VVALVLGLASLHLVTRSVRGTGQRTTATVVDDARIILDTEPMDTVPVKDADLPVYPYSIIPGGAATPAALARAIEHDPVVRAHYSNFDLGNVRLVRLTEPHVAHVSYRIGDQVFWTRRPLILRTGETMLTDGVHYARTRCGNQLAAAPLAVSGDEPAAEVFDTPLELLKAPRTFPVVKLPTWTPTPLPVAVMAHVQQTPPFFGRVLAIPAGRIGAPGTPAKTSLEGDASPFPYVAPPSDTIDPLPPTTWVPPTTSEPPSDPPLPPNTPVPPGDPKHPDDPGDPPPLPPNTPTPPQNPPDDPTPVPEPGTILMLAGGAAWLGTQRKRSGK
jgi:hypothetical protein